MFSERQADLDRRLAPVPAVHWGLEILILQVIQVVRPRETSFVRTLGLITRVTGCVNSADLVTGDIVREVIRFAQGNPVYFRWALIGFSSRIFGEPYHLLQTLPRVAHKGFLAGAVHSFSPAGSFINHIPGENAIQVGGFSLSE